MCLRTVSIHVLCSQLHTLMLYFIRDLHGLSLDAVNAVLSFTGFDQLQRVEEEGEEKIEAVDEDCQARESPAIDNLRGHQQQTRQSGFYWILCGRRNQLSG